jgi:diguanylate cyclase (GGDEF)-like protein
MSIVDVLLVLLLPGAVCSAALYRRVRTLEEQVVTDALTGAFNRRHMGTLLGAALDRYRRSQAPSSLLAIDIDGFKNVNDEFGHAQGDRVLCGVVEHVRARLRSLDAIFRAGGEEFVVLLPDTRFADAWRVALDLRGLVHRAELIPGRPVSVSIGVAELGGHESVEEWLEESDDALYRAKDAGRNRVAGREQHAAGGTKEVTQRRLFWYERPSTTRLDAAGGVRGAGPRPFDRGVH